MACRIDSGRIGHAALIASKFGSSRAFSISAALHFKQSVKASPVHASGNRVQAAVQAGASPGVSACRVLVALPGAQLPKLDVEGSSPFARSEVKKPRLSRGFLRFSPLRNFSDFWTK